MCWIYRWEDKVDVWQANIVVITCLSVIVYSENEVDSQKFGEKLNKPAILTFYNIFSKQSSNKAQMKFKEKVYSRWTSKIQLLSYNADAGIVTFCVEHFRKHEVIDNDDKDDEDED